MEPAKYHTSDGYRAILITQRGRKLMQFLVIEASGVTLRKVPLTEERHMAPLTRKGAPYPAKRALAKFRKAAKRLGATKTARRVLK